MSRSCPRGCSPYGVCEQTYRYLPVPVPVLLYRYEISYSGVPVLCNSEYQRCFLVRSRKAAHTTAVPWSTCARPMCFTVVTAALQAAAILGEQQQTKQHNSEGRGDVATVVNAPAAAHFTGAPASTSAQQWLLDWRLRNNGSRQYCAPSQLPWHGVIQPSIFQLAYLPNDELRSSNGPYMRRWCELNPDFHYHLLSEADCVAFVQTFGSDHDRSAYASLKLGAQRADVCRVHLLLHVGGVYADADVEPRRPLRHVLPANASAARIALADGAEWPFTFLAFAAAHPIMRAQALRGTNAILEQQRRLRSGSDTCNNALSCVLAVTGPFAFGASIKRTFEDLCAARKRGVAWPCESSHDERMRATFLELQHETSNTTRAGMPLVHHHCHRPHPGVKQKGLSNVEASGHGWPSNASKLSPNGLDAVEKTCSHDHYSNIRSAADVFLVLPRSS